MRCYYNFSSQNKDSRLDLLSNIYLFCHFLWTTLSDEYENLKSLKPQNYASHDCRSVLQYTHTQYTNQWLSESVNLLYNKERLWEMIFRIIADIIQHTSICYVTSKCVQILSEKLKLIMMCMMCGVLYWTK